MIPKDIRDHFPQDDQGRILFFATPPLDTRHVVSARSQSVAGEPLSHSDKYLEAKETRDKLIAERKRKAQDTVDNIVNGVDSKRLKPGFFGEERDTDGRIVPDPTRAAMLQNEAAVAENKANTGERVMVSSMRTKAMEMLSSKMVHATAEEYLQKYGEKALEAFDRDRLPSDDHVDSESGVVEGRVLPPFTTARNLLSQNFWTGRYPDGSGRFEDDYDNRLPR